MSQDWKQTYEHGVGMTVASDHEDVRNDRHLQRIPENGEKAPHIINLK